jgi:glutamate decarboxylase
MQKNMNPSEMAELSSQDLDAVITSCFASRYMTEPIPKLKFPENGAPAHVVYQLIKDLRTLDCRPNLNLASFVTTWMEPEAEKLMAEVRSTPAVVPLTPPLDAPPESHGRCPPPWPQSMDVNFIDADEYPSCTKISSRCVSMLAGLYHSPAVDAMGNGDAVGAPGVGSSEAIMLGGLAMKKRWAARRVAAGKDASKPNLVMGAETHVCWEKFCRYWCGNGDAAPPPRSAANPARGGVAPPIATARLSAMV